MRSFIILLFVLGTLFVACDTPTDAESTPIADVLKALETAYNNADLDAYKATLDASSYLFHFSEQDQQGQDDVPETLNYSEDVSSTENMFNTVGADNVELTLSYPEFIEPEGSVDSFQLKGISYDVYVTVESQQMTYHSDGTCDIYLSKVESNWLITDLFDYGEWKLPLEMTSWGMIKLMWLP